ncbi:hypothetical protein OK074_4724 [Actinobacteria bacterium OK074]|nr:hypothetical protein OK074_4724 [Actinobacteria bacterium OK074]
MRNPPLRHRITPAALCGLLTLAAVGLASPSAYAAESDAVFSDFVVNGGKPVVVGTSKTVYVLVSYTFKNSVKVDEQYVFLYRDSIEDGKAVGTEYQGPYCKSGTSDKKYCEMTVVIVPKDDLVNADATLWKTGGIAYKSSGGDDIDKSSVTARLKRQSRVTLTLAATKPVQGKKFTITGKITRANWNTHKFGPYGGRSVTLQFKAKGSSTYTDVRKVTATSTGALKTTVTAGKDGSYRWAYFGNTTSSTARSGGGAVDVQ